ncbi:23S rRNA (adenine(2503)-C(2))-methyltransferase RlmN, partial [Candidatus Sumerlaeota bacterium]|nr:23S rRNA (adenine(2503)-C(2))-methyltransferase RlmN [Candidatus Sumerlaeota bacterium]
MHASVIPSDNSQEIPRPAGLADLPALRGMTLAEMQSLLEAGGYPPFRAKQLYHWIYKHGAESWEEMKNLPKELKNYLIPRVSFGGVKLLEAQGSETRTRKVVWGLRDGKVIESVVMRDEGKGRTGLCLSSQVGCAVGCTFCLTGYGGFQRQCSPDEIVGQVLAVRRHLLLEGEQLDSLVFMGMGEPMLNLDAVIRAIRIIADPEGIAISPRRITVSTSGVIPGIVEFGRAQTGANLAVSLNATTDPVRASIMPLNNKWPIQDLIKALGRFPLKPRQRITIEYVLLKGINDKPEDAKRLAALLRPLQCKVNLIMFNPHELLGYHPVSDAALNMFTKSLADAHYTVAVRWSKG